MMRMQLEHERNRNNQLLTLLNQALYDRMEEPEDRIFEFDRMDLVNLPWCNCGPQSDPANCVSKTFYFDCLGLTDNHLRYLPECFSKHGFHEINLSNNKLESLPQSFGNLQELRNLYLQYNVLTCLPQSFVNLQEIDAKSWTDVEVYYQKAKRELDAGTLLPD
jgi:hypothetical protein